VTQARSFPKNVMSDTGQRGRLIHNEQLAPFYGSVPFENAPNLHADSRQAEMRKDRRLRCSLFRCLPLWPFLVFLLSDWWKACATSAAVGGGAPAVSRWHAHLHSLETPIHALSGLGPKVEIFHTFRPILPFRQPSRLKPSYQFLAVPTP